MGKNTFGVLGGVNYTKHDWDIKEKVTQARVKPDDDWTDAVLGVTHRLAINDTWAWTNRIDYGFGDSEGTLNASTGLNWKPFESWMFNFGVGYRDVEFGACDYPFERLPADAAPIAMELREGSTPKPRSTWVSSTSGK